MSQFNGSVLQGEALVVVNETVDKGDSSKFGAVETLKSLITEDQISGDINNFMSGERLDGLINVEIDDIRIYATVEDIHGPNVVLGATGVELTRPSRAFAT